MNRSTHRRSPLLPAMLVAALACAACNAFPCLEEHSGTTSLQTIDFDYDTQRVRYTYWFEDGAQRVVFDRAEVPQPARASVLVHIEDRTSGELHGPMGWAADIRSEDGATAVLRPMAMARATAYVSWSGDWRARWTATRAGLLINEIEAQRRVDAGLAAAREARESQASGANDSAGQNAEAEPAPTPKRDPAPLPDEMREQLLDKGISVDVVKRQRALRAIGARRPLPRDFGLSLDVHPLWLFVEDGCAECETAIDWLDGAGIGYHAMRVADPTNARTLRDLSKQAGVEPAVPTAWSRGKLLRGFSKAAWKDQLTN